MVAAEFWTRGGVLEVLSRDAVTGVADGRYGDAADRRIKTVWKRSRHDAGAYGSSLITEMLGRTEAFSFPKSLYAVEDTIMPLVRKKKDALILDFFAGSGTTMHATCLMNWRDRGKRRCILVTNNEVAPDAAAAFGRRGLYPGVTEFEEAGICNAVTWSRVKAAISGFRPDGTRIKGDYLGTDADGLTKCISSGFQENAEYFTLDFIDPHDVARGEAFKTILPNFVANRRSRRHEGGFQRQPNVFFPEAFAVCRADQRAQLHRIPEEAC